MVTSSYSQLIVLTKLNTNRYFQLFPIRSYRMIDKSEKTFGPPERREGVKKNKLIAINFIYAAFKLLLQRCFLDYKHLKLLVRTRKLTK